MIKVYDDNDNIVDSDETEAATTEATETEPATTEANDEKEENDAGDRGDQCVCIEKCCWWL